MIYLFEMRKEGNRRGWGRGGCPRGKGRDYEIMEGGEESDKCSMSIERCCGEATKAMVFGTS